MQGGRSEASLLRAESSVLGRWGRLNDGASSGNESEVEVVERLSLGSRVDEALHVVRVGVAVSISLPIAWLTGHSSIGAFRARKVRLVEEGTQTVLALQARLRHPALTLLFEVFSFCAEEEFCASFCRRVLAAADRR
jgi:hypothetical protein